MHEEDGKAVAEPEDKPQRIIDRIEQLVEETTSEREEPTPVGEDTDPVAKNHREAIRSGAEERDDE